MAKLIDVEERDLNYIFGKDKPYHLDVYQRDYRWSDEKDYKMITLFLKDIELRFEYNMKHHRSKGASDDLKSILKDVQEKFKAYFINSIMLNEQGSNIYIVDGQQRLTTLMLVLIKLYHLGVAHKESHTLFPVQRYLGEKIYEMDMAGEKHFKISNLDRNVIVKKIFNKETITDADIINITQFNLKNNYDVIGKYFDKYFFDENGKFKAVEYNAYVYNMLTNILVIEQIIKDPEDVAFIFETANDRGKDLEPHEVLKGMLLGVLNSEDKEIYNTIWNKGLETFFNLDRNYKNVDEFFRTYFRAKYANNTSQYTSFGRKYHRALLSNDNIGIDLDRSNPTKIKDFLDNEFQYFYKIYLEVAKIARENSNVYVASNYGNEQGQQTLLIMSALTLNDEKKAEKISLVAKKLDQFYTISSLVGAYDSRKHQTVIHDINAAIRNAPLNEISDKFDTIVVDYLKEKHFPIHKFNDIFEYKYFSNTKINGKFTKYVLARIDYYLADLLNESSFSKMNSFHFIMNSGRSPVNGFHIEHMFANNDLIKAQFTDDNGEVDEKQFNDERNRLGAIILLKGNENIRTSNKVFKKKYKSYSNSGFIWNKILTNSINKASLNSCQNPIKNEFKAYQPDTNGLLEKSAIDERQELLFKLIKEIYKN